VLSPPTAMHTREIYGYAGDIDDLHALYCHMLGHHSNTGTAVVTSAALHTRGDEARFAPSGLHSVKVRGTASALTSHSRYTIVEGRPAAERARMEAHAGSMFDRVALDGLRELAGDEDAFSVPAASHAPLPGDRVVASSSDFGVAFDLLADAAGDTATVNRAAPALRYTAGRDRYGIPVAGAHVEAARVPCFADDGDMYRVPFAHFGAVLKDIMHGSSGSAGQVALRRPPPGVEDLARRPTDVRGLSTTLTVTDGKTADGKFADIMETYAYDSDDDADTLVHGFAGSADIVAGMMRDLFNESQLEQLVAQVPLTGIIGVA
jgi:hypothetical protein